MVENTCSMSRTLDISKYKFISLSIYTHTHTYTTCTHKYTHTLKYYIHKHICVHLSIYIYDQISKMKTFGILLWDLFTAGVSKHLRKELYCEYFWLCGQNICHICLNVQCESSHKTSVNAWDCVRIKLYSQKRWGARFGLGVIIC